MIYFVSDIILVSILIKKFLIYFKKINKNDQIALIFKKLKLN